MATVSFSNTADSGEGSFRAALDAAEDGDVLIPDPDVFRRGERIVIPISSLVQVKRSVQITSRHNPLRIVSASGISLYARNDCEFLMVDGVEFVGRVLAYFRRVRFDRCLLAGNAEESYALQGTSGQSVELVDTIVTGARRGGIYQPGPDSTLRLLRTTVAGNREASRIPATVDFSAVDSIVDPVPSAAGFVLPPPDDLAGAVGALPWESWNLAPTLSSPYAAGCASAHGEYDALGVCRGRARSDGSGTDYAVGALEAVDADYYLVGVGGSFRAPENWSTTRGGAVTPAAVSPGVFLVDAGSTWTDAPPDGSTLLVAGRAAVRVGTSETPGGTGYAAILGRGTTLSGASGAASLEVGADARYDAPVEALRRLELASDASLTLTEDAALDALTLGDSSTLVFAGGDRVMRTLSASVGANVLLTTQGAEGQAVPDAAVPIGGYAAAPPAALASLGQARLRGTALCALGAALSEFTATSESPGRTTLRWRAADASGAIRLEERRVTESGWRVIDERALASPGTLTVAAPNGRTSYRAFDGERFWIDDAWSFSWVQLRVVAQAAPGARPTLVWEVITALATTSDEIMTGQGITILARIFDAFDASAPLLADRGNVVSVTYTCYYVSNGLFEETLVPVTGHEEVDAGAECVLEAAQRSDAWTADAVGYTFVLTPDVRERPLFEKPGEYRIKTTIRLSSGNPVVFYVPVTVVEK